MQSVFIRNGRRGDLMVEVLLGIAIFVTFVGGISVALSTGQAQTKSGGDRVRGAKYAAEALEAVRSIRDTSFASLTPGAHGVALDPVTGKWIFSGTQSSVGSGYTVSVTLTTLAANRVYASATATWARVPSRPQTATISSIITDWRVTRTVGNWGQISVPGSYVFSGPSPQLTDITVVGTGAYAYATGKQSGAGLFVFDVRNQATPQLAATFNLAAQGLAIAAHGAFVYILTDAPSGELQVYYINNPLSPALYSIYDLPDSAKAGTLFIEGNHLYVGLNHNGIVVTMKEQPATLVASAFPKPASLPLADKPRSPFWSYQSLAADLLATCDYNGCWNGNSCGACSSSSSSASGSGQLTCSAGTSCMTAQSCAASSGVCGIINCSNNPFVSGCCCNIGGMSSSSAVSSSSSSSSVLSSSSASSANSSSSSSAAGPQTLGCNVAINSNVAGPLTGYCDVERQAGNTLSGAVAVQGSHLFDFTGTTQQGSPSTFDLNGQGVSGIYYGNLKTGSGTFTQQGGGSFTFSCINMICDLTCGNDDDCPGGSGWWSCNGYQGAHCIPKNPCFDSSTCAGNVCANGWCVQPYCVGASSSSSAPASSSSSAVSSSFASSSQSSSAASSQSSGASSSNSAGVNVPIPAESDDFFVFDITSPAAPMYRDSLTVGGVNAIQLSGTSAYLATSGDTAELRVVNVTNPAAIVFSSGSVNGAPVGGYNLSDRTVDGLTVALSGTAALIGTQASGVADTALFEIRSGSGVPLATPGPWLFNGSGSAIRIAADPTACYAFVATTWKQKTLQVIKISDHSLQLLQFYQPPNPASVGAGKSIYYDAGKDRLYLIVDSALYIAVPAAGSNNCS